MNYWPEPWFDFMHHSSRIIYDSLSPQPLLLPGVTFLSMNRLLRRPWVIAAFLVVGVLIAGCLLGFRSYHGPAVVVVSAPSRLPAPKQPLLSRIIPMNNSWSWFWRFKQAVFGGPRAVSLEATIISFPPNAELTHTNLDLGEPTYIATNGVRVWVLAEPDLKRLGATCLKIRGADTLTKPRISTADAIEASLFVGEVYVLSGVKNSVGVSFDCYPRVHRDMTELTTGLLVSEALTNGPSISIRTNMDVTARVRLDRGNGFFLLDAGTNRSNGKPMGVLVSVKVPKK